MNTAQIEMVKYRSISACQSYPTVSLKKQLDFNRIARSVKMKESDVGAIKHHH